MLRGAGMGPCGVGEAMGIQLSPGAGNWVPSVGSCEQVHQVQSGGAGGARE